MKQNTNNFYKQYEATTNNINTVMDLIDTLRAQKIKLVSSSEKRITIEKEAYIKYKIDILLKQLKEINKISKNDINNFAMLTIKI